MSTLAAPPKTETLSRVAGEQVVRKYGVSIGDGRIADLVVLPQRVNIYLESGEEPVAVLRFGSLYSGAMWLQGNLMGEFSMKPTGSFVVVEIEDGFKRPTPVEDVDPLQYLLDRL